MKQHFEASLFCHAVHVLRLGAKKEGKEFRNEKKRKEKRGERKGKEKQSLHQADTKLLRYLTDKKVTSESHKQICHSEWGEEN